MTDWINEYVRYTSKHEAPESFHRWTAITILGAAMGRRIWIDRAFYRIYPNVLCVVVAGSANMRKSTAIGLGKKILSQSKAVPIIDGKHSPEAFVDSLSFGQVVQNGKVVNQNSHALVFASELSSFLSKQAYTEALIPILTHLADCPDEWEFKTRGHGSKMLYNVCLNFLGASTPDWLADAIPANSFGGGFMSRIIFVYEEKTDRSNPMPEKEDLDPVVGAKLISDLQVLSRQVSGQIYLSPHARTYFVEWYKAYMSSTEGQLDGYWGRRPDHLLRTSMIYCTSQGRQEIQIEDIDQANRWLLDVENNMAHAFKFVGATSLSREQDNIVKIIRKSGGDLSLRELMHMTWRKTDISVVRQAVETLKAAGIVEESIHGGDTVYVLKGG